MMVDYSWTSKDVYTIWGAIQFFAPFVRCLTVSSCTFTLFMEVLLGRLMHLHKESGPEGIVFSFVLLNLKIFP